MNNYSSYYRNTKLMDVRPLAAALAPAAYCAPGWTHTFTGLKEKFY
jgi:hypothetical protein